ncbi:MAG: UbiA family prenyltransferase [candidate division WOR-3 bacterium]
MKFIRIYLSLTKFKIAFLSTFSGLLGYYIKFKNFYDLFFIFISLYLLSSGSLSLNQYIERNFDKLMERTKNRPIVKGDISPFFALLISIFLITLGLILIFFKFGVFPFILGFITFFIYIFIYTPLKRKTPYAFLPGSIIGALPPLIGWVSAGGDPFSPTILSLSLYFLLWQIPHFMLLFYIMSDDYKKAGFRTIKDIFDENKISIILYNLISGALLFTLSFPLFGIVHSKIYLIFSLFTAIYLLLIFSYIKNLKNFKRIFSFINYYTLFLIITLMILR